MWRTHPNILDPTLGQAIADSNEVNPMHRMGKETTTTMTTIQKTDACLKLMDRNSEVASSIAPTRTIPTHRIHYEGTIVTQTPQLRPPMMVPEPDQH